MTTCLRPYAYGHKCQLANGHSGACQGRLDTAHETMWRGSWIHLVTGRIPGVTR